MNKLILVTGLVLYFLFIGPVEATQTYSRVLSVDKGGGANFLTIVEAVTSILSAGGANANDPYVIDVGTGVYDEDVILPDFVSLKGKGSKATVIDGRVTVNSGSVVSEVMISPTGSETVAVEANPIATTSYLNNVSIYMNGDSNIANVAVRMLGTTDFRVYNSFVYGRNINSGSGAKTVLFKTEGAGGDLEVQQNHVKSSCPNNGNCILAWNASTNAGSDILLAGNSWSVFWSSQPVGAINDNVAGGLIKLQTDIENGNTGTPYRNFTTQGRNIIIEPMRTGNVVVDPGSNFSSGVGFEMSSSVGTTVSGELVGAKFDLVTNFFSGNNSVTGVKLNVPNSGSGISRGIELTGNADYGLYFVGESGNYLSSNLQVGTSGWGGNKLEVEKTFGIKSEGVIKFYNQNNSVWNTIRMAGNDLVLTSGNGNLNLESAGNISLSVWNGSQYQNRFLIDRSGNIEVGGGVKINSGGTRPDCSDGNRGLLWYSKSVGSAADVAEVCVKDVGAKYSWKSLY